MINLTRAKRISGWMNDKELEFLATQARKANVIIEIGSYFGRSCMAMADNTFGKVYAIDPYKGFYEGANPNTPLEFDEPVYEDFLYNLSEHLATGKVVQFRGIFKDFNLPGTEVADLIFIDGDHSYLGCKADIEKAMKLLSGDGIIAGHDYKSGFPGVEQAVNEVLGNVSSVETIWWTWL